MGSSDVYFAIGSTFVRTAIIIYLTNLDTPEFVNGPVLCIIIIITYKYKCTCIFTVQARLPSRDGAVCVPVYN